MKRYTSVTPSFRRERRAGVHVEEIYERADHSEEKIHHLRVAEQPRGAALEVRPEIARGRD